MIISNILILLLITNISIILSVHDSLNFFINPWERKCFYEDFDHNSSARTIEIFIKSGGYLDIKFVIHGPLDLSDIRVEKFEKVVIEEYIDPSKELESETGTYELQFKPTESGTYGICLDNRQSSFLKEVSLDVRLAPRPAPVAIQSGGEPGISEEEQTVTRIQESLARINKGLNKLMIKQLGDRHRLDLHKETNVMSHKEVVYGSLFETIVFIAAAIFQLFFVRRWFSSRHTSGSKQRA